MSSRKIQLNDEIILYSDDEDGDYLDSNENNRLIGSNDGCHHKIRRKEKKFCNPCPTLGIVLMCILVSLYIFLYNVYTSNSPSRVGTWNTIEQIIRRCLRIPNLFPPLFQFQLVAGIGTRHETQPVMFFRTSIQR